MLTEFSVVLSFTNRVCLLQDQHTNQIVGVAKLFRGLYILNKMSFSADVIQSFVKTVNSPCIFIGNNNDVVLSVSSKI